MKEILINQKKYEVSGPQTSLPLKIKITGGQQFELIDHNQKTKGYAQKDKNGLWVFLKGHTYFVATPKVKRADASGAGADQAHVGDAVLSSPMPAKVFKLLVKTGDEVKKDQEIVILEAMKMEHSLTSPKDGVVAVCTIKEGDMVELSQEIIVIK